MGIRKELPDFINGFRVVEDLGMIKSGEMKLLKKTGWTECLRRGALFECHVCKKIFKNTVKNINKYKSCGCQITKVSKDNLPDEIHGYKIIEDLDVISYKDHVKPIRCCVAICKKCGDTFTSTITNLKRNPNGCSRICSFSNGGNPRLCKIIGAMRDRCYNPKHKDFHNYGGRSINICDEWRFDNRSFYEWSLENGYAEDLSLDRINGDLGYSPSNCRWADKSTQSQNSRNAKLTKELVLEIRGMSANMTGKEIASIFGVSRSRVSHIINRKTWFNV